MKKKDFNYDEDYEVDIHIWRKQGMPNSKAMIQMNNKVSVITATTSFLENLLRLDIATEEILDDMVKLAKKGAKGELEEDGDV